MISFRPTEEELSLVGVAKDFAKDQLRPAARPCEEAAKVDENISKLASELGFTLLELSESGGGLEFPLITQAQVLEALAWGDLAILQGLPGAGDSASILRFMASSSAVQSVLEALTRETNPETAVFLDGITRISLGAPVSARRKGAGWVLEGTSLPLRNAAVARFLLAAVQDDEGTPLLFLLDRQQTPWEAVPGDVRLGLLAAQPARLRLEGLEVGGKQCIAQGAEARERLEKSLARIRVLEAAKEVGLMRAALEYTATYTAQRRAFGQEIAKFQGVSFTVADMAMETEAARVLTWRAAVLADNDAQDAAGAALGALNRAHRAIRFVTNNAVQLLGGHGFVQEHPVEKWMRDAQAQVMLYGRERELLADRGEILIAAENRAGR
jgi:acyl-CoA dehydrogenase